MSIKTFSDGNSLPASDINTYLTNSGLVYVTSVTVGTGVSSVTVSSCFSSTYDAYKIIATNVSASGSGTVAFALGGITTGWYGNLIYSNFLSGAVASFGWNNTASVTHAGGTQSQILILDIEIANPFLAKAKSMHSSFIDNANAGSVIVQNNQATSATAFTITPTTGTLTGGQITVYGYRKA